MKRRDPFWLALAGLMFAAFFMLMAALTWAADCGAVFDNDHCFVGDVADLGLEECSGEEWTVQPGPGAGYVVGPSNGHSWDPEEGCTAPGPVYDHCALRDSSVNGVWNAYTHCWNGDEEWPDYLTVDYYFENADTFDFTGRITDATSEARYTAAAVLMVGLMAVPMAYRKARSLMGRG